MYLKLITILSLFLLVPLSNYAQEYECRFYIGANYYQGDLTPTSSSLSYSQGQLAFSSMIGVKINDVFRVNTKLMVGKLAGKDSDSDNLGRKRRNLSFQSPLYELGINTEVNLNHFFKGLDKYGLRVYYTTGINVFNFSPKAFKRDEFGMVSIVDLQPLGTEGQGLPGYDDRYSLTQINIPFGIGFRFHLFDNIEMGVEVVPRVTFTDYLDDVSGMYVPYEDLEAAGRPIAAMMSNRIGEFLGTDVVPTAEGTMRGNPNNNDWYFFTGVYLSYNWGSGYSPLKYNTKPLEGDATEVQPVETEEQNK